METQTSFDLTAALQRWRASLERSSSFQEGDLDELEAHIRDSAEALRAQGLTDEESFLIAIRRTGQQEQLMAEYATINGSSIWLNRLLWLTIGWVGAPAVLSLLTLPWSFYDQRVSIDILPVGMNLAMLVLLLNVGLRRAGLRTPLKLMFGFVVGLPVAALVVSRAFPAMAFALPVVVLALGMVIGLPFTRTSMAQRVALRLASGLVLVTLLGLMLAVDSASGPRMAYSNLPFPFLFHVLAQWLAGICLIIFGSIQTSRKTRLAKS